MPRVTIIADAHTPEAEFVTAWLSRWKRRLDFVSDYEGCGCCVDIYRVAGPTEALDELPAVVLGGSEWSLAADTYERARR
jgi:hypothetical protein